MEHPDLTANIQNTHSASHKGSPAGFRIPHSALRWLAAHEWLGVLVSAPLLLFPTPASVIGGTALLLGLRLIAWRALGRLVPAGVPGLPALWLLGMAAVGTAITLDATLSLPRLAGLLLGLGVFYAAVAQARQAPWPAADGRPAPVPWALLAGGLALALLMPLVVDWTAKAPAWLPPDLYATWPGLFHNLLRDSLGRVQDGFAANALAGMLALLFPPVLALATLPRARGVPAPRLAAAVAAIMALSLLATQSRGGLLAAAGAAGLFLAWRYPRARPALIGLGLIGALGAGVALLGAHAATIGAALAGVPVETQSDTALFRLALWDRALAMIADHPFTGVGLNNFPVVQQQLYPLFPTQPDALVIHAHNVYLQAALDFGVPGLLALLAFGGSVVRAVAPALRATNGSKIQTVWLAGCCAGLIAGALFGLTDALAVGSRPGLLVWLIAGLAVGAVPCRRPAAPPVPRLHPALVTLVWATLSLAACTLVSML